MGRRLVLHLLSARRHTHAESLGMPTDGHLHYQMVIYTIIPRCLAALRRPTLAARSSAASLPQMSASA